jgi:Hydrolytic ATP binding site of dynein motor region
VLAFALGRLLIVIDCTPILELSELARSIHGAASLGAWLCLADMENLHPQVAARLQHVHHEATLWHQLNLAMLPARIHEFMISSAYYMNLHSVWPV